MNTKHVLSRASIDRLIRDTIPKWWRDAESRAKAVLEAVAQAGVDEAMKYFGADCDKEPYSDGTGYYVNAKGEHVCFVEFGTGVYTDSGHQYAGKVGIGVYPGSWSETHMQTWQKWLASGKDPYKYPFNSRPKYGMLHTMDAMRKKLEEFTR